MTARVILWRHGQTDYNQAARIQGQIDIALNQAGRAQAESALLPLVQLDPSRIYASDLVRAVQTASALAGHMGLEVFTDVRLRERAFGQWEGLTKDEITERWPNEYVEWRQFGDPQAEVGVEARSQVGERVAEAVREFAGREDDGKTIVCVSHGSAITQGVVSLLGLDPSAWHGLRGLDNCHWSVLEPQRRAPGWSLVAYNQGVMSSPSR